MWVTATFSAKFSPLLFKPSLRYISTLREITLILLLSLTPAAGIEVHSDININLGHDMPHQWKQHQSRQNFTSHNGIGESTNKFVEKFLATRHDCGGCICKYPCFADHCVEPQSCFNGGRVIREHQGANAICQCPPYFEGQCCKLKVCSQGSRLEGDTCVCKYPEYQFGEHCEKVRCEHNGVPNEGYCKNCPWLWTGPFCNLLNCVHGGRREMRNGSQVCACAGNGRFYGDHCHRVKCDHGGLEDIYSGNCRCPFLFKGQFCEELNRFSWGVVCVIFGVSTLCLIYCCWKPCYRKCMDIRASAFYKHSNSQVQLIKVNSIDVLSCDSTSLGERTPVSV